MERIRMQDFDSKSVKSGGYDARSRTLRLRFAGGHLYDYRNVPRKVFNELLRASSKGQFVNWHVKPFYPYRRLG
ncbi:MAG: KTSC domain-containing protein [Rhodospirillaceae bacterium]|nr:MAG: KTSC domain-containing protein [Rhodospirillaceae bacterium]